MARTVNVSEIIDGHKLSRFQIGIIVWCLIVALIDGFDALSIAFAAPLMAKDLAIPINAFGPIFGAGTLGLTVGALTLPVLADRFGRKAMIILACVIFGILTLATVLADSFSSLLLIRLATGLGVGAATPNCVALATEYAPAACAPFSSPSSPAAFRWVLWSAARSARSSFRCGAGTRCSISAASRRWCWRHC